jgi:hypothetical protein
MIAFECRRVGTWENEPHGLSPSYGCVDGSGIDLAAVQSGFGVGKAGILEFQQTRHC